MVIRLRACAQIEYTPPAPSVPSYLLVVCFEQLFVIGYIAVVSRRNWLKTGALDGIPATIVDDYTRSCRLGMVVVCVLCKCVFCTLHAHTKHGVICCASEFVVRAPQVSWS